MADQGFLEEKSHDTPWELDGYHVYPDPRARFGDVSNPDKPPIPLPDLAVHKDGVDIADTCEIDHRSDQGSQWSSRYLVQVEDDQVCLFPRRDAAAPAPCGRALVRSARGR